MTVNTFFKWFKKYAEEFEYEGFIFKYTGKDSEVPLYGNNNEIERHSAPIYRMENPKDLPYTRIALRYAIDDKVVELGNFMNQQFRGFSDYIIVENMKEVYIPTKIKYQVTKCLQNKEFKASKYNSNDKWFVIEGKFTGDFFVDFGSNQIDMILDFELDEIRIEDNSDKVLSFLEYEEAKDILEDIKYDLTDAIDDTTWECFRNNLIVPSFVDFDLDMYWYNNIRIL